MNDAAYHGFATGSDTHTLYSDAQNCCASKFGWMDNNLCTKRSIGGAGGTGQLNSCAKPSSTLPSGDSLRTNKWYDNTDFTHCVKDCESSASDTKCIEVTDLSVKLYNTALECCQKKLSWLTSDLCVSKSEQSFTNKFYVDELNSKCLKDCDAATPG